MANQKQYREITISAMICGCIFGVMLTACFTYAGLLIGFTIGGSAVAAVLGFGVLRGIFRKGTIVETNITQTIASGINITTPGVIFTIPAFYLMGVDFNPYIVCLAAIAGSLLGVLFIIPIRKQMIDLERLRFPTGTAVATVLKSPGASIEKSLILGIGIMISAFIYFFSQFPILLFNDTYLFGITGTMIPSSIDVGEMLRKFINWPPPDVVNVWAISMFSLGAGYISGRPGLVILAGGVLAYWIITPMTVFQSWIPTELSHPFHMSTGEEHTRLGKVISEWVHGEINRPIGIGMLIGGALTGIILSLPAIKASFKSLRQVELKNTTPEELPLKYLVIGVISAFILLFIATYFTATNLGVGRSLLVAGFGTFWLAFAGIVVAQATGMTDWSPISGMALLGVVIVLFLTNHSVEASIVVGVAIAVAVSMCADMMQDMKTGYLVGATPIRQQYMELSFAFIGPIVSLTVIALLWNSFGFGPGKELSAPQAQALQATIEGMEGGNIPWPKYVGGAIIACLLSFTGIPGIGVLIGLSMYLPIQYILPYGLGCLLNMATHRFYGAGFVDGKGIPFAAGLLVGEPLIVVGQSILIISQVIQPPV